MTINRPYPSIDALPGVIPVFPLAAALMLPHCQLPLTIFEPRYLAMMDDALKSHRLVGMIQPDPQSAVYQGSDSPANRAALRAVGGLGRITRFAETGDGRYVLTLTGVARFRLVEELAVTTPYRQCRVDYREFAHDLERPGDDDQVDRDSVVRALRAYAQAHQLNIDWREIERAPSALLVNALSVMSPFGPDEKQALLEARDLKARAETLVAITEIDMARNDNAPRTLQ